MSELKTILRIPRVKSLIAAVVGGIQFQDEGVNLGDSSANTVDFTGAGVTASRSGDKVTVSISAGGSSTPSINVEGGTERKISDMTALTAANVADGDLLPIVDVSDTTDAATGTNKKILGSGVRFTFQDRLKTSRYHGPVLLQAPTTQAGTINQLRAVPFIVWNNSITIDQIVTEVTTGTSGNVRLGIYDDSGCYPNALLHDSGNLAITAPAVITSNISPNITLRPGLYWFVLNVDTANTFRVYNVTNYVYDSFHVFGRPSTLGTTLSTAYILSKTYGTLPNPFTAGASVATLAAAYIAVRIV